MKSLKSFEKRRLRKLSNLYSSRILKHLRIDCPYQKGSTEYWTCAIKSVYGDDFILPKRKDLKTRVEILVKIIDSLNYDSISIAKNSQSIKREQIKYNEFDIQAELYHQLKLKGLKVRMAIALPSSIHSSGRFFTDLAIYDGNNLKILIECKAPGIKHRKTRAKTKQQVAYENFKKDNPEIKVLWLNSFSKTGMMAEAIHKYIRPKPNFNKPPINEPKQLSFDF